MSVNVRIDPLNIVDNIQVCCNWHRNGCSLICRNTVFTFITANKAKYLSTFEMKVHLKIHILPISIYFDIMSKTMSA